MMRSTQETAWALFHDAVLDDDDRGYPPEVAFVPADEEWADTVVWRHLSDGRPTVLVSNGTEVLLLPAPRTLRDRVSGHVRVIAKHHVHGHGGPYGIPSVLGHHPVRQMRELALD